MLDVAIADGCVDEVIAAARSPERPDLFAALLDDDTLPG